MGVVIADTGPVHYLILIEQISLLPALFERVFIPVTVRDEMLDPKTPDSIRQWISAPPGWLEVLPDLDPRQEDPALAELNEGERAAVQLTIALQATLISVDDGAGVVAAKQRDCL